VHSAHTLAKVKNAALAAGEAPEPTGRMIGEQQVVAEADLLLAGTDVEADQLVSLYGAEPARVSVVHPGVDVEVFAPADRAADRAACGFDADEVVIAFAGRIQPHKGPAVVVNAVAALRRQHPARRFRCSFRPSCQRVRAALGPRSVPAGGNREGSDAVDASRACCVPGEFWQRALEVARS
jgi:D-inositol-3-phosphate glycosyltransferase